MCVCVGTRSCFYVLVMFVGFVYVGSVCCVCVLVATVAFLRVVCVRVLLLLCIGFV